MQSEYHSWPSPRLGRDAGLVAYGHWGAPALVFPTRGGDEWEMARQGLISALAEHIDAGRVKIFTVSGTGQDSFSNTAVPPLDRSAAQVRYDGYIRHEVLPFIRQHCESPDIPVTTMGMAFGAYHAVNTLFKHPDVVNRCYALSGTYDMKRFMDGTFDDNFYFNNPVDYLANLDDAALIGQISSCEIRLATGDGPWEDKGPTYRLGEVLRAKQIPHALDDWGAMGGHDWPYWKHQLREYLAHW